MRQIVLSDFTADMLAQRDRERGDRHATAMAAYREQVDSRSARVQRDYEAAVKSHEETMARWDSSGFRTRLGIGLFRASALLRLFGLSLLVGLLGWVVGALASGRRTQSHAGRARCRDHRRHLHPQRGTRPAPRSRP